MRTKWSTRRRKLRSRTKSGEKVLFTAEKPTKVPVRLSPEGSHIDDYVVETQGDQVLGTFSTQKEAIDWSKEEGHTPHVARVRHLNDKKRPDHWRAV